MGVPRVTDYCRGPGIYAACHPHLAPSGLRRSLNAVGDAPQRGTTFDSAGPMIGRLLS
jgi:hypothetical protein